MKETHLLPKIFPFRPFLEHTLRPDPAVNEGCPVILKLRVRQQCEREFPLKQPVFFLPCHWDMSKIGWFLLTCMIRCQTRHRLANIILNIPSWERCSFESMSFRLSRLVGYVIVPWKVCRPLLKVTCQNDSL